MMKNFKIVMILIALAIAMFCSCADPETQTPTASILDAKGMNESIFDFAKEPFQVTLTAKDNKGLKSVDFQKIIYNEYNQCLSFVGYEAHDCNSKKEYIKNIIIDQNFCSSPNKDFNIGKIVYKAVVTNRKDAQVTVAYTVNVIDYICSTVNAFEWVREGNNSTGLDTYGLRWYPSTKDVKAVIKPLEGAKLYILEEADYAATRVSAINFPTEASQYKRISRETSGYYNHVIATVYNGKIYVMNVTKGTVTTSAACTKVIITGNVKTFEPVRNNTLR